MGRECGGKVNTPDLGSDFYRFKSYRFYVRENDKSTQKRESSSFFS